MNKIIKKLFSIFLCCAMFCALALTALPVTSSAVTEEKVTIGTTSSTVYKNGKDFKQGAVTIHGTEGNNNGINISRDQNCSMTISVENGYITKIEVHLSWREVNQKLYSNYGTCVLNEKDHTYFDVTGINNPSVTVSCDFGYADKITVYYHTHTLGEPAYKWASNGSSCTASAVCSDCGQTISENGTITSKVKTRATSKQKGTTTYTATFSNPVFTTQTKDVQNIKMTISASDFKFNAYNTEYDGQPHSASIGCGLTDVGKITYRYFDSNGKEMNGVPVNAGTYTVKIDVAETENRQGAVGLTGDNWKYTITPVKVGGTPENKEKVYGEDDPELTVIWGGLIGDDIPNYTITREPGEDAGTYEITISGDEYQGNYHIHFSSTGEFTIKKSSAMTVTGKDYTGAYDGTAHGEAAEPSVKDGTTIYYSTDGGQTWDTEVPRITDAGSMTVSVKAVNKNYNDATGSYKLTVTKSSAMTVTGKDYTGVYDGTAHGEAAVPSVTDGTTVYYSTDGGQTWDTEVPRITDAGSMTVSVKAVNKNYNDATGSYKLTVAKSSAMTVTGKDYTGVYDGTAHGEAAEPGVKNGTTVYYSTDNWESWGTKTPTITGVGSITVSVMAVNKNYNDATGSYKLTVTPKPVGSCTIEGFTLNFVENGKELQPKPVVKDGDKVLTEGKDYTLEYADNITAGTATITVTGKGNYSETATVNFTIVKAESSGIQDFTKGQAESDAVVTIGEGTVLKLSDFKRVLVDGKEISSDCYTIEDGCIKITLLKSYLNTLKTGKHTLKVELGEEYDGVTCQTSFKVKSVSPATGDDSNVALWGAMLSAAGAAVVMTGKKRKED